MKGIGEGTEEQKAVYSDYGLKLNVEEPNSYIQHKRKPAAWRNITVEMNFQVFDSNVKQTEKLF